MNIRKLLSLLLCGAALNCMAAEDGATETKVEKLNGTSVFGIVEITDDYTLKVKTDSGLQNIPLAMLSEKDFQKYAFKKDRSQDGRLWSERKQAVESSNSKDSVVEVRLAEIAPFQPFIDAYEKTQAEKKATATSEPKEPADTFKPLFSRPGAPSMAQPFGGFASPSAAAAAGSSAISTVGSGATSLPTLPSVP